MDKRGSVRIVLIALVAALLATGGIWYFKIKQNSVSSGGKLCSILSFTSASQTILRGGTTTLTWSTQGCRQASIETNDGLTVGNALQGSIVVGPIYSNTYYNLNADIPEACPAFGCSDGNLKQDFKQVVVTVIPNPADGPVDLNAHTVNINGTLYLIAASGAKYPYTSIAAFNSYAFNTSSDIVPPTKEEISLPAKTDVNGNIECIPPREGSLIHDGSSTYLITEDYSIGKLAFPSVASMTALGYSPTNIFDDDISVIPNLDQLAMGATFQFLSAGHTHFPGDVISNNGKWYLLKGGEELYPILNTDILYSYGYTTKDILPATSEDMQGIINQPLSILPTSAWPTETIKFSSSAR